MRVTSTTCTTSTRVAAHASCIAGASVNPIYFLTVLSDDAEGARSERYDERG